MRQRQPGCRELLEEAALELAERDVHIAAQDPAQASPRRGRSVSRPSTASTVDGCGAVTNAGLVASAGQVVGLQHRSEVHDCARDGGDGDRSPDHRVARIEATRAARADAVDTALGGSSHLGGRRRALEQPEQVGGRPTAQQRAVAAGPDRREVLRLEARSTVSDAIDARVLAMERADAQALGELCGTDASTQQLPARHDTMCRARHARQFSLNRVIRVLHCTS